MSRAFRLGVFILVTLLILTGGVLLIGNRRFLFRRTYQLNAQFQNVAGLNDGADVRVGGIHLGTVKKIELPGDPTGKLTVAMDMTDSTRNIIRKNSIATIKTEGLLGNKYVEISFGSEKSPEIMSGDTIKGETPVDFSDTASAATQEIKATAAAFKDDAEALKSNFFLKGFFNRRGYTDESDLKENKISRLPSQPSTREFDYNAGDLFDKPDNAKLKNAGKLDEAGKFLEQGKFKLAVISASSETGDTEKDRVLTQARAKVVRDYLVQKFKFDDTRVKVIGLGKSRKENVPSQVKILVYASESGTKTSP